MAQARVVIDPPLAAAPRIGLLSSIPPDKSVPEAAWGRGIQYLPEGCVDGETFDICSHPTRDEQSPPNVVEWVPYILSIATTCSTFSGLEDNQAKATRQLNMMTETLIGDEFWDGAIAQTAVDSDGNPYPNTWLANVSDVDILTETGPVGLVHGLACLQQYLAATNGGMQGAIHATPQVVTHWESFRLLRREGNRILTMEDHVVIPSPGYSGTSPDGAVGDDNVWAYATDMPRIFLGEPQAYELEYMRDQRNNSTVYQAQRKALVEFERCRHAGVRLAVSVCGIGGS